jgi:anthranilate synthase component I
LSGDVTPPAWPEQDDWIELAGIPDLLALQRADPRRFPVLLESAAAGTPRGRYDFLFATDGAGFELLADGRLLDLTGAPLADPGFLAALDRVAAEPGATPPIVSPVPFTGGWALYLGYELAAEIEPSLQLPAAEDRLPVARAWRCPAAFVVDRAVRRAYAVAERGHAHLLAGAFAAHGAAKAVESVEPSLLGSGLGSGSACEFARSRASAALHEIVDGCALTARDSLQEDPPQRYLDGVRRALAYIAAGDVFQVNLSRRWQAELAAGVAAADLHAALRRSNPAPFSALLEFGDGRAVVSSSPERLVARRGERLETRPIAGTRARLPGDDDAGRVRELVGHPKERAEHIMLIDLERNDLGRVSRPGSVRVDELMAVESYAHVHHIESTVSGVARPGVGPGALIRAVFPGGTITGCPKVRCMEIIAELEGRGRGAYTGGVGWLDRGGDLDLNILIRTLSVDGRALRFCAGAGVVTDSDPGRELEETRAKARGLLRALGVAGA